MATISDRRTFKRITFQEPLQAVLEAVTVYNQHLKSPILVLDMSAGGLKFLSDVELEVNYIDIFKVGISIEKRDINLFGNIIRRRKVTAKVFEYSFKFNFSYTPKSI